MHIQYCIISVYGNIPEAPIIEVISTNNNSNIRLLLFQFLVLLFIFVLTNVFESTLKNNIYLA